MLNSDIIRYVISKINGLQDFSLEIKHILNLEKMLFLKMNICP